MIYNINNSVLSLKVKHCMFSMLELAALESSLEVELAEVEAVGLLHLVVSVEVEEAELELEEELELGTVLECDGSTLVSLSGKYLTQGP